jgi:hypothetical protein
MKYLGVYCGSKVFGDTINEIHEDICDEQGYLIGCGEIEFYQLTPITVEHQSIYSIKPLF